MFKREYLPRCHWNKQHGKRIVSKMGFETINEETEYISNKNLKNYMAYECPICHKFHIGHNCK